MQFLQRVIKGVFRTIIGCTRNLNFRVVENIKNPLQNPFSVGFKIRDKKGYNSHIFLIKSVPHDHPRESCTESIEQEPSRKHGCGLKSYSDRVDELKTAFLFWTRHQTICSGVELRTQRQRSNQRYKDMDSRLITILTAKIRNQRRDESA